MTRGESRVIKKSQMNFTYESWLVTRLQAYIFFLSVNDIANLTTSEGAETVFTMANKKHKVAMATKSEPVVDHFNSLPDELLLKIVKLASKKETRGVCKSDLMGECEISALGLPCEYNHNFVVEGQLIFTTKSLAPCCNMKNFLFLFFIIKIWRHCVGLIELGLSHPIQSNHKQCLQISDDEK